jgi:hypothetical protein
MLRDKAKNIFATSCPETSLFRLFHIRGGHLTLTTRRGPINPVEDELMPLLGPADVAKWLGVSSAWVRDHATRKSPLIPAIKIGKLLRFRKADVKDFLRDRFSGGNLRVNDEQF